MRCTCCNKALNDYESTNKTLDGDYADTCIKCLKGLGIPTIGRPDLNPFDEPPDGEDDVDDFKEDWDDDFEPNYEDE